MIKYILPIVLFLAVNSTAQSLETHLSENVEVQGHIDIQSSYLEKRIINTKLSLNVDYKTEYIEIYSKFNTISYSNISINSAVPRYDSFYVDMLYTKINIYDDLFKFQIATGIIPLTGGDVNMYSNRDTSHGSGLRLLNNFIMLGVYGIVKYDNFTFISGYGEYNTDYLIGTSDPFVMYDGTNGYFNILKYVNHKHIIIGGFNTLEIIYNSTVADNINISGLTYIFDNSIYCDYLLYISAAYSTSEQDGSGYAYILGAKKYNTYKGIDVNYGIEYTFANEEFAYFNDTILDVYYFDIAKSYSSTKVYTDIIIENQYTISPFVEYIEYDNTNYNIYGLWFKIAF